VSVGNIVPVDDKLRMAIVGVGRMGSIHARTLAESPLIDVVAVVDSNAAVAAAIAAEVGATPLHDLGEAGAAEGVEAWLVATPTTLHPAHVRRALAAGVHVLCEKPLALDPAESEALGAAAAAADRVLHVGFWRRFAPPWAAAKEALDAGAIGRPLLVRLSQWDADPPPATFCDPNISGGLAIDCGVHEYDLAEWMTGLAVERVTARSLPLVDQSLGDVGDLDNLVAVLDLADGTVATVDLSRNCRYGDDVRTEILGSDGALFVDLLPTGRTRLATAAGIETLPGSVVADAFTAGILRQAEAFARVVRGEPIALPGAAASTRAVAIGLAVRAAGDGTAVTM
jgi:predicted dehydrogenase